MGNQYSEPKRLLIRMRTVRQEDLPGVQSASPAFSRSCPIRKKGEYERPRLPINTRAAFCPGEVQRIMRSTLGLVGLVLALAIGYYVYTKQIDRTQGGISPKQQIDLAGVRSDLLSIAQAERIFLATNGAYATLEQLQQAGSIHFQGPGRRGYLYDIEIDGNRHFRVIARPADPSRTDSPTLFIDETMQISVR